MSQLLTFLFSLILTLKIEGSLDVALEKRFVYQTGMRVFTEAVIPIGYICYQLIVRSPKHVIVLSIVSKPLMSSYIPS